MRFPAFSAALILCSTGFSAVFSPTPTLPPIDAALEARGFDSLYHHAQGVYAYRFSQGQDLKPGWEGTIDFTGEAAFVYQGKLQSSGKMTSKMTLAYDGYDGESDTWNITAAELDLDIPNDGQWSYRGTRLDFGQAKIRRPRDISNALSDQDYVVSAFMDLDEFRSVDGGQSFTPTGDTMHFELNAVPEPATMTLLLSSVIGLVKRKRKR